MTSISAKLSQLKEDYTDSLHHHASDLVGIRIRSGSSVLKVSLASCSTLSWNPDASTTVGNTPVELVDICSLVSACHACFVALAIDCNMFHVTLLKLVHHRFDGLETTIETHILGRDVGVETGTVPVTWYWLGVEGDDNAEFFCNTVKQEAGHPKFVTNCVNISLMVIALS